MSFRDQVAIVTGGASGIGKALCEELARRGAVVVVADRNVPGAHAVAAAIGASAASLDVRDAESVQHLVDETAQAHGRLDLIFNNAGIGCGGEVRDLTLDTWRTVIEINLMGVIHGCAAAYPLMVRQASGHIVNIASLAGLIPAPGLAPYATTKSGVVGLSAALRAEGKGLGVRVSAVCPGFVKTAIVENAIGARIDQAALMKKIGPLLLPAEDAARAILRGIEKNQGVIVFPASARLSWRLCRIHPRLLEPYTQRVLRSMRALRKPPAGS